VSDYTDLDLAYLYTRGIACPTDDEHAREVYDTHDQLGFLLWMMRGIRPPLGARRDHFRGTSRRRALRRSPTVERAVQMGVRQGLWLALARSSVAVECA